ncbi:MAG: ATP-binding cassette domain-containing protein [Cypionkella sp.]|jgi:peptide/nickel transport system ATP-binding protein|nr:ATP-binding cassette domain-containing protein [Cypionkella sp.]
MTLPPTLSVENLTVSYPVRAGTFWRPPTFLTAVDEVTFAIAPGETLGLVGESGSGKTTVGRAVMRRVNTSAGRIFFRGEEITQMEGEPLRKLRARMQLVLQDPYTSLNPRMRIADIVAEPLLVHGRVKNTSEARDHVRALLDLVGMPADAHLRYPHSFSGGQRQRVGIARALALEPDLIVADEPVSALDVSVQAQVVNLLQDIQQRMGLSYLFIAHDLSVVRHISHRIAIMYAGRIVEIAPRERVFAAPVHPYTKTLLSAVPIPDPKIQRTRKRLIPLGEPVDLANPPPGCRFQTRCAFATDQCRVTSPPLLERSKGHVAACWNF